MTVSLEELIRLCNARCVRSDGAEPDFDMLSLEIEFLLFDSRRLNSAERTAFSKIKAVRFLPAISAARSIMAFCAGGILRLIVSVLAMTNSFLKNYDETLFSSIQCVYKRPHIDRAIDLQGNIR